jgi:hypothetical protein
LKHERIQVTRKSSISIKRRVECPIRIQPGNIVSLRTIEFVEKARRDNPPIFLCGDQKNGHIEPSAGIECCVERAIRIQANYITTLGIRMSHHATCDDSAICLYNE